VTPKREDRGWFRARHSSAQRLRWEYVDARIPERPS
jgi:hypothetical protein